MSSFTPPQRPRKSRLRTLSAIQLGASSSMKTQSTHQSRFKELFDKTSSLLDETSLHLKEGSSSSIARSSSFTSSSSSSSFKHQSNTNELNLPIDPLTLSVSRIKLKHSASTPLQKTKSTKRHYSSNGSILVNNLSTIKHQPVTAGSLNRADVIISRLEGWHLFLKSIIGWLEEVSRIHMLGSRAYLQRAYPFLDESCAISTKTVFGQENNHEQVNQSILTIQAGLQVMTMQLAAEQQGLSHTITKKYMPHLEKLRKEVKEKIHKLKHNHLLVLDELLRRAEVTRNKMHQLNRYCKEAEKAKGKIDMDPWLANVLVLAQLKREIDEENRLRLLMIPIQHEAKDFEQRVINAVKPAIEYCYQKLAPGAWDGSNDEDVAPFELLMNQILPLGEWDKFVELNKDDLVDEENPKKDYLKINYPNKFHPLVRTIYRGKMKRKVGTRKQYAEREFVLSQGGYLHEFTLDTKVTPERTLYIPTKTIIPSIDVNQLMRDSVFLEYGFIKDSDLTFEICKLSTHILQKDKVTICKAATKQEFLNWCRLLLQLSTGSATHTSTINTSSLMRKSSVGTDHSTSSSHASHNSVPLIFTSKISRDDNNKKLSPIDTNASVHSKRTTISIEKHKSIDEKTPTMTVFPSNVLSQAFGEQQQDDLEEQNFTDTESFVTARLNDDNDSNYPEDNESGIIDDYFSLSRRGSNEVLSDDNESVHSNETAKLTSSVRKSPSLSSTQFEDAQSSLYFSSNSVPQSPTLSDEHSSIASMPEFDLLNNVIESSSSSVQDTSNNSRITSDAEIYKASLNFQLNDD